MSLLSGLQSLFCSSGILDPRVGHMYFLNLSLSSAILTDSSIVSPVHVLMFFIQSITNILQRVFNAAAWVVIVTSKFDRCLMQLLHADLHSLDVHEHVKYKLYMMMCWCQDSTASQYLVIHWASVSEAASRQYLHLPATYQLIVLPHRSITYSTIK